MRRSMAWLIWLPVLFAACGDDDSGHNHNGNGNQDVCGDGVVGIGEECDDGALNSDLDPDACRTDCRWFRCGDGVRDANEECDDGNGSNEDSCLTTCVANVCGDGFVNRDLVGGVPTERCDDGNTDDGDLCRGDCQQDLSHCGDGVMDPDEGCDDGTLNSDSEPDACRTDCQPARCGDGVPDGDESCDCGVDPAALPDAPLRCMDVNGGADANCSATCEKVPYCGDGVEDAGEECDDGPLNSDTAPDACRSTCRVAWCGDGVVDSAESCDGTDLGGETCQSLEGTTGTLDCTSACDFDTSQCAQ